MSRWITVLAMILLFTPSSQGKLRLSPAEDTARVRFVNLKDGARVKSPLELRFKTKNFSLIEAGKKKYNGGHAHVLVDTPMPENRFLPLPHQKTIIHLDKGERKTFLRLRKGKHKLQLVMGDHRHVPHNPIVTSKVIEITVE